MSERLNSLLKPGQVVKENSGYSPDPYLDSKCPMLSALMSMSEFEGNPRACATLILFCEDGRSKVTVNNKAQGTVAFVTLESFEDVFEHLEECLEADKLDWRAQKGNGRYRG